MSCLSSQGEPSHVIFDSNLQGGGMALLTTSPKTLHTTTSLTSLRDTGRYINDGPFKSPEKPAPATTEGFDHQPLFMPSLTRSPVAISGSRPDAPTAHRSEPKRRNTFAILARGALNLGRNKTSFAMALPSAASSNALSDTESSTIVETNHEDQNTATHTPSIHTNPGEIVRFWRKITRRWSEGDAQKKPVLRFGILRIASMMKEKETKQKVGRKGERDKGDKKEKKKKNEWRKHSEEEGDEEEGLDEDSEDEEEEEEEGEEGEEGEGEGEEKPKKPNNSSEEGKLPTPRSATKRMTPPDVVSALVSRGCKDLSKSINRQSFPKAPIACGGLSDIYRGQLKDGTLVAMKAWRISTQQTIVETVEQLCHAASELYTWGKCDHPNVLRLLGLAKFRGRIGMVSPWMNKGTLPQYMSAQLNVNRHDLCVRICVGLTYLHEAGIVHGDLKGANILIADDGTPVLADFGSSTMKDQTLKIAHLKDNLTLTLRWSAPELLQGNNTGRHTKQSDIYALGMTLYEVITGKTPYHFVKWDYGVMLLALKGTLPHRPMPIPTDHQSSKRLWDLFTLCWRYQAEERPSSAEVGEMMRLISLEGVKYWIPEQAEVIDGPQGSNETEVINRPSLH